MKLPKSIEKIGHHLSYLLIPHEGNNHHPWAIRHQGLALFVLGIFLSQVITNLIIGKPAFVLGFATDVHKEELISLTNQQRQSLGASQLVESPQLSQAALLKGQDMFAKNYWAHVAPDGTTPWHWFNVVGYAYQYAGENLARGFDTSNGVVQGWMSSSSHKENLLNPNYHDIGMAVVNGQLDGESTTLVVQLFGTTNQVASAQTAPPVKKLAPSAVPTIVEIGQATSTASVVSPVPPIGSFPKNPLIRAIEIYQPKGTLNANQQVLLLSLTILATIFIVDAVVLARKRMLKDHSHSIVHAMVIITLIAFILFSGKGFIL